MKMNRKIQQDKIRQQRAAAASAALASRTRASAAATANRSNKIRVSAPLKPLINNNNTVGISSIAIASGPPMNAQAVIPPAPQSINNSNKPIVTKSSSIVRRTAIAAASNAQNAPVKKPCACSRYSGARKK